MHHDEHPVYTFNKSFKKQGQFCLIVEQSSITQHMGARSGLDILFPFYWFILPLPASHGLGLTPMLRIEKFAKNRRKDFITK